MITDLEVLQSVAELCVTTPADAAAIGFDAIAEVSPGGHFFATTQTMARYRHAFYEPLVADLSNFGNWTEAGSKTATERAQTVWRRIVADFTPPAATTGVSEILDPFIAQRTAEGGAAPVS
jgi:trimethylamine--corrinoid protein Co-methyltransferase